MSVLIERASVRGEPGKWWPVALANGGYSASIICPKCCQPFSIMNHSVAPDGSVGPSVVCPYGPRVECPHERCGWHEVIRLGGWPPGQVARRSIIPTSDGGAP